MAKGWAWGMLGAGAIFTWSGLTGASVTQTIQQIIKGQKPTGTNVNPITGTGTTSGTTTGSVTYNTSAANAGAAANQALGKQLAAKYGWDTGANWSALVSLWNGESGWNNTAQNPGSTAYGIAQFLDTTWAGTGYSKTSNPTIQIEAGLLYIKLRYGSPSNAYSQWLSRSPHWY